MSPTDTLFFRDGRPYNQGDEGLAHARSLFPPHPSTLTGALRAALALGRGWNGGSPWSGDLTADLGDGPDMTGGTLRFGAPLLLRMGNGGWEPLYPAPRALVGTDAFALLRPGRPLDCDLGDGVRLPEDPAGLRRKPVEDLWLTSAGLALALDDRAAELDASHMVRSDALWTAEPRVGLALDKASRTARHGQLYAPVHVRLADRVALAQPVEGLPEGWKPTRLVPLGGEHRTAMVDLLAEPPVPPRATAFKPAGDGTRRCVMLVLLSPARVGEGWLRPGALRDDGWAGAEIVSACLGDPVPIGGWDSRPGETRGVRGPRPLRAFLPASSTWFLHAPEGWSPPRPWLGDPTDARHGFGRFALGTFTDIHTDTGADPQGVV
nr:type III-B CRISPR module-associated Cmr3 family protein [Azospirillum soli]